MDAVVDHEAIIVGAGFGGMGFGIALQRAGIDDFLIIDREDDLGGTWHVNRYPGLAVDIPSSTYSFTFLPNPNWSRLFAPGRELKAYCEHVADTFDLRRHMRFNTTVEGAEWADDHWRLSLADGSQLTSRILIVATGHLSQPRLPDIPGVESFAGTTVHTAKWDEDLDLTGRRVGVIGTGATSVQLVPAISRKVEHMTVFQRTPIWVAPKLNPHMPKAAMWLFRRIPLTQRAVRFVGWFGLELLMVVGVLRHRRSRGFFNWIAAKYAQTSMFIQLRDKKLRRAMTPTYSFGCKRPTVSSTYFRTFNRDNVELETASIQRIDPDAVVMADGRRHEIDTLVLATGYDLWESSFPAFPTIGRDGRDLGRWWRDGRFESYEGLTLPHFPNLFSIAVPYSYASLSFFETLEPHMDHVTRVIGAMQDSGAKNFEVTDEASRRFSDNQRDKMRESVFISGDCAGSRTYYYDPHGEPTLLRSSSTTNTARDAKRIPLADYTFN